MPVAAKQRTLERVTWRPHYAAPTWQALWAQMHATMGDRAGRNVKAPPLTNAEAASFIRVWRGATTSDGKLWYQLAAAAYGWDPPTRQSLRVDAKQAAAGYTMPGPLWDWSKGIANELDARGLQPPASLAPNKATFGDPTFYGEVRAHLLGDGADPRVVTGQRTIAPARDGKGSMWPLWVAVAWFVFSPKRRSAGRRNQT